MAGLPAPRTKIEEYDRTGPYAPAPLDETSSVNGLLKYDHVREGIDPDFSLYAFAVLDSFFPHLSAHSQEMSLERVKEKMADAEHGSKSSGYPYAYMGLPTKRQVVDAGVSLDVPTHVLVGALKDELRLKGKDARLFRLASAALYALGLRLFDDQNEYLSSNLFRTPMFVKYMTPGPDLSALYSLLDKFGLCGDADGQRWDTLVNLSLVEIIAQWRARYLPEDLVKHYYEQTYLGHTLFCGHLWRLIGQASGHVNTTVDNSLINILSMAYHAYSQGLGVQAFIGQVRFFVCGDDLIWADRSGLFEPLQVAKTYALLGQSLELGAVALREVNQCQFVGTRPVLIKGLRRYTYNFEKLLASAKSRKKGRSHEQIFQKLVQLYVLVLYDQRAWQLRQYCEWFAEVHLQYPTKDVLASFAVLKNPQLAERLYIRA